MDHATTKSRTRIIQVVIDEETYESFQLLRKQSNEPSDSSLGRKIITDHVLHELNVAGTQRHFQATFQDHIQRNEWLLMLLLYMMATLMANVAKLRGHTEAPRDILLEAATVFSKSQGKFNAEITRFIDQSAAN